MKTNLNGPSDTRMMNIVHNALRRDIRRTRDALGSEVPPADRQRKAIAEHLCWIMDFLHVHHSVEDDFFYPLTRQRRPECAALLDDMHADHERVAPTIAVVTGAATAYRDYSGDDVRRRLLDAVEQLDDVLTPHLQREEDEAMPLVSEAITEGERLAIEKEHILAGKSLAQLGMEGHWLIDEVSPEDRDTVIHTVPPVPRFILVHGFARSYRRRKEACWGGGFGGRAGARREDQASAKPAAPRSKGSRRVQRSGQSTVRTDAPIDGVWEVARDVTRTGEWSHECVSVEWIDGAIEAVPGARFRGRNRAGRNRWGRTCEIVSAAPYEVVWRTIPSVLFPDSTEWSIRLVADGSGTRIEQGFKVVKAPPGLDLLFGLLVPNHRDRNAALEGDLRRLGALAAEAASQPTAVAQTRSMLASP